MNEPQDPISFEEVFKGKIHVMSDNKIKSHIPSSSIHPLIHPEFHLPNSHDCFFFSKTDFIWLYVHVSLLEHRATPLTKTDSPFPRNYQFPAALQLRTNFMIPLLQACRDFG